LGKEKEIQKKKNLRKDFCKAKATSKIGYNKQIPHLFASPDTKDRLPFRQHDRKNT
jgi:hypothetical protein